MPDLDLDIVIRSLVRPMTHSERLGGIAKGLNELCATAPVEIRTELHWQIELLDEVRRELAQRDGSAPAPQMLPGSVRVIPGSRRVIGIVR